MTQLKKYDFTKLKNDNSVPKPIIDTSKPFEEFALNLGISKPKKSGKSKKELISDISKTIKNMESVKIPKIKKSKAIPQMLEIAEMIVKTPKN